MVYLKSLNVIKEMVTVQRATIQLWMHLGGWLITQEARVALGHTCKVRVLAQWFLRVFPESRHPQRPGFGEKNSKNSCDQNPPLTCVCHANSITIKLRERSSEAVINKQMWQTNTFS